jgi:predicted phosphodiesterase
MLPDFNMIIHKFPEREDITIIPIADVHLGARECMEQEFIKFIDSIKDKPNVYLVLGGDLINNATRSSVTNIFEEIMRPADQKKEMSKILAPVAHKILAAVSGNHERRSGKDADDDPTYDILCKIDREDVYRENMAFVKFQFGDPAKNGENNPTYTSVVTHGAGGGALTSGAVLKGERFGYAIDGMDALIMGHTHKPFTTQPGKIVIDKYNNKVSVKPFKVINMTSWLDYSGYAAAKMLLPSSHCMHTLTLRGTRKEMVVTM